MTENLIISGWTEEEIVNYKKQSSVVLTSCQCLLYSLWKKLNQIDTGNPVSQYKTTTTLFRIHVTVSFRSCFRQCSMLKFVSGLKINSLFI